MKYIFFDDIKKYPFVNIAFTTKDLDISKEIDREVFCKDLDFNFKNLTFNKQVHGNNIAIIDDVNKIGTISEGDGLITKLSKVPIMVFVADCVSIGFIDTKNKVIGCAHAGWRGTFEEISSNLIKNMKKNFNSKSNDIICIIGPSIGPCCYEVGEDLIKKFNNKFTNIDDSFYIIKDEKYFLDLWRINEYILINNGIKKENIINLNLCTHCNGDLFHSYRRDKGTSKRMGFIIELI
ncbi:peptidoglycan editing factor PgeF [Tepidibacter formicigenes]|uniref:Purine nucleoside phosphorylase n=1 Tax=Tepidibacter formicigenes DSM 15518 TaxID=1123349 RepID=A0A1M6KD84_9FIRM|nr:peptidoglycan editing factor PgeF [Tepidibacter formicigenes]SHJ56900.1 conserved hypothetical protein [Tepidibacter formicigenes DSM 15518]